MRANEISMTTPLYTVHLESFNKYYPTSIERCNDSNGEYFLVKSGTLWARFRPRGSRSYEGNVIFYLNVEDAQQIQLNKRQVYAREAKEQLDKAYEKHKNAQYLLYSPLSTPE